MSRSTLHSSIMPRLTRIRRVCHTWRRMLWRKDVIPALLVLCTLVLGEPLVCIIHCQFWLPAILSSHIHHHHSNGLTAPESLNATIALPGTAASASEESASFVCFVLPAPRTPGDNPSPLPPSPVHEVVTMVVALLALLLLLLVRLCEREHPRPRVAPPRLLRPPIPFAA